MKCPQCNSEVNEGRFCEVCGAPLVSRNNSEGKKQYKKKATKQGTTRRTKKSSNTGLVVIVIILSMAAVILIGFLVYSYFTNKDGKDGFSLSDLIPEFITGEEADNGEEEDKDGEEDSDEGTDDDEADDEKDESQEDIGTQNGNVELKLGQVDTTAYPSIKLYISINSGKKYLDEQLNASDIKLYEMYDSTNIDIPIKSISQVHGSENLNINFVMDTSASMINNSLLETCKDSAREILEDLDYSKMQAGIISFDDKVRLTSYLTNNYESINNALTALKPKGKTALYDALMLALDETNKNSGSKLIIAFTDGIDNMSSSTADDVISRSNALGIPIYLIGIKYEEYDTDEMERICQETNGEFISIDDISVIKTIFEDLMDRAAKQYVITYESVIPESETNIHDISIELNSSDKSGEIETSFIYERNDNWIDLPRYDSQKQYVSELYDKYFRNNSGEYAIYFGDVTAASPMIINDKPIRSASTIKLFIMIETMQQVEDGVLSLDTTRVLTDSDKVGGTGVLQTKSSGTVYTVQKLLEHMMGDSDNTAANMLIDIVGGVGVVNNRIKALGCVNSQMNRKLLDMDALANGLDNYVTVYDMGNILTRIYNGQCVSTQADEFMLYLMSLNKNHQKLPYELPSTAVVYNKTGEFDDYGVQNDVAIIETKKGTYVLCVLNQNGNADEEISSMRGFSKELYYKFIE